MSVENKIKELLKKGGSPLSEAVGDDKRMEPELGKDTTIVAAVPGDQAPIPQGSSQAAGYEEREEDEENQGAIAAKSVNPNTLQAYGPGAAPNFIPVADPTAVVDQPNGNAGNVAENLNKIFGEDLSEEFKTKATSIFEAAVVARVNKEMISVNEEMEKRFTKQIDEAKEGLANAVDSFLNYVVEQWMVENSIAIDRGLRTEITEEFITGLRKLFSESYIDVPEDKYDLVEELQGKTEILEGKLNESVKKEIDLATQVAELKKQLVFENSTVGMTMTDKEKLKTLVEGVDFENEELYADKLRVIKESHFGGSKTGRSEQLTEDIGAPIHQAENSVIDRYARALSRASVKTK